MAQIKILLKSGQMTEIPEGNLDNFKRLCGHMIEKVVPNGPIKSYEEILDDIENEDNIVTQISDDGSDRLQELLSTDRELLKTLAEEIANRKGIEKPKGNAGKEKLANFIFANED